jgi:hypothetical protein
MFFLVPHFLAFLMHMSMLLAETNELPIEAATSTNSSTDLLPSVVICLLCLLGTVLVVSGTRRQTWSLLSLGEARNLFLSMRFSEIGEKSIIDSRERFKIGHLRYLSLKAASFVCPSFYPRGARLMLSLDSLANFPKNGSAATAEVAGCRALGGEPASFLVSVRIVDLSPDARYPLLDYLSYLSHPGWVRHT